MQAQGASPKKPQLVLSQGPQNTVLGIKQYTSLTHGGIFSKQAMPSPHSTPLLKLLQS